MKQIVNHTFEEYYNKDSEILILGSIPSIKSRELGFYYMHPKNRFWIVISKVFDEVFPETLEDKKEFLKRNKIALWDVIKSYEINASSDSSISNVIPNDIKSLLSKTNIKKVYVTGKKALELYQKYIYSTTSIEAVCLPSTSPANAAIKLDDLIEKYKIIKENL